MSDNGIGDPEGSGLTAAEYVLGVLDAAQRHAAERRIARDPAFARDVAFWEERLGVLADAVPPAQPPAGVWTRIEAALSAAAGAPERRSGVWQNLAFWRGLAIASSALAAACVAGLLYLVQAPTLRPPLVAKLDETSGKSGFFAAANPVNGSLTIVPAALLTGKSSMLSSSG
jgi:anti-sigma-K factor RskA